MPPFVNMTTPATNFQVYGLDKEENYDQERESCREISETGPQHGGIEKPRSFSKRVTFKQSVRVRKGIHINEYKEDEVRACWYSKYEYKQIKTDNQHDLNMLSNGAFDIDGAKYCLRGIEAYFQQNTSQRRAQRARAVEMVLYEQDLQKQEGSHDPEVIAQVYQLATSFCLEQARHIALQDEFAATVMEQGLP